MNTYTMILHSAPTRRGMKPALDTKHVEAFCIMQYAPITKIGKEPDYKRSVLIWNSRDGVTPFNVFINGEEYHHVNFRNDRFAPDYFPVIGDLIFRDITDAEAQDFARRRIESFKNTEFYPGTDQEMHDAVEGVFRSIKGGPILTRVESRSYVSVRL